MPDIDIHASTAPAGPPPAIHPMDPARGDNLSPAFAAVLAWAIGRPAMTEPAITGVVVSGGCVFAATTASPFHDTLIGSWPDLEGQSSRLGRRVRCRARDGRQPRREGSGSIPLGAPHTDPADVRAGSPRPIAPGRARTARRRSAVPA